MSWEIAPLRPEDREGWEVLARGCSVDLRARSFGPGRCAQTLLARAQVIIHCVSDETFRLFVRPSFAPYLRAWLADAIEGEAA